LKLYQVLLSVTLTLASIKLIADYRKLRVSSFTLFQGLTLIAGLLLVSLFPTILESISSFLGFKILSNFLLLGVVLFLGVRIYVIEKRIHKLDRNITIIIREISRVVETTKD
jgi:hypothetical protein